ncbi:U32 family peptidase [Bacteroidota bacterium]
MNSNQNIEIMAPVGSYESLQAAIQGGADSVYFGTGHLNMRSKSAGNFMLNDMERIVEICRENDIKCYLTLNTVIYNADIPSMWKAIDAAKKVKVDAIIASDVAVIQYAANTGMPVHISTQLNIGNIESVRFFARFADVMVLARELDLEQVKEISKGVKLHDIKGPSGRLVRLELFAHGALCMSISGKCYLSLHEYNMSANRGECLQLCRRGYTVTDNETGHQLEIDNEYIISLKDLCTIHFLDKIINAGVSVLKIEGRARSPEYVKTVAQCYKEAILSIQEGTYSRDKIETWKKQLASVFNRGFWDGYYLGQKLGEWSDVYGSKATKKKIYIGKGNNYFSKIKVAEFIIETGELEVGDEILVIGPTTGVLETTVKEIRVNLEKVNRTIKGDNCSIPIDTVIRRSDKLYKLVKT